jgi:cystathionine beta-lyase/cystathionine gamma-synthase
MHDLSLCSPPSTFTILSLATKYLGGHSDLLSGVLIAKTAGDWQKVSFTSQMPQKPP